MITMLKNRSRNFFIKTARFKSKLLLKYFKTCDLVIELERRTDVVDTMFVEYDRAYEVLNLTNRPGGSEDVKYIRGGGPAVILVVTD